METGLEKGLLLHKTSETFVPYVVTHFPVFNNSGVLPAVDTHNNLNECPGNYSEWEKSQSLKVTYCMIPFI